MAQWNSLTSSVHEALWPAASTTPASTVARFRRQPPYNRESILLPACSLQALARHSGGQGR